MRPADEAGLCAVEEHPVAGVGRHPRRALAGRPGRRLRHGGLPQTASAAARQSAARSATGRLRRADCTGDNLLGGLEIVEDLRGSLAVRQCLQPPTRRPDYQSGDVYTNIRHFGPKPGTRMTTSARGRRPASPSGGPPPKWMPKVGIEPTLPEGNRILSPARLPVPPLRPGACMPSGGPAVICVWRPCPRYLRIRSFQGLRGAEQIPVGLGHRVTEEESS